MKKVWIFLIGLLSGVILTILVSLIVTKLSNTDISFFEEPGEVVTVDCFGRTKPVNSFKIFQTLGKDAGLAFGEDLCSQDLLVLVYSEDGQSLFDNQTIIASKGKCFRQIGIYKYKSRDKMHRTIPVVMLMNGENEEFSDEPDVIGKQNNDYSYFDEPGEIMSDNSYKVDRVLDDGAAIARGKSEYGSSYYGLEVLLQEDNANYYNDQIVKASSKQCFRQIGIYKTEYKTLPIVKLMDK